MTCEQFTLHIGLPRTGTTTIQSFLYLNRECLHRHGISYFGPGHVQSLPNSKEFFEQGPLRCGLQEMNQRLKEDGTNRLLWSHEWLSAHLFSKDAICPGLIRRELPASRYRIVIYLRRQDHRLASGYLQAAVKCKEYPGRVRQFDDWLRGSLGDDFQNLLEGNADYAGLIQPWIDVFGRENIVVRVLEKRQLLNGNLLQDFCDAAELPATDYNFDVADKNVSFNMELHDMLGMYNSVFEEACYSTKMNRFIESQGQDEFFSRKFFSRFAISPKCRVEILRRCEESNRKVAKDLLGREDGVLFREPWPSPDEPHQPYDGLTTDKLVPIFLQMLRKQDDRIQELEERLHSLPLEATWLIAKRTRSILRRLKQGIMALPTLGKSGMHKKRKKAPRGDIVSVWGE